MVFISEHEDGSILSFSLTFSFVGDLIVADSLSDSGDIQDRHPLPFLSITSTNPVKVNFISGRLCSLVPPSPNCLEYRF
jgi:hypothetical protein